MNVSCPECRSVFRVDPGKIPNIGVRARCSVCGGVITVAAGESVDEEFAATPSPSSVPSGTPAEAIGPSYQGSSGSGDDRSLQAAADIGPGFQGSSGSGDDRSPQGAADIGPGFQGSSGSGDERSPQGAADIGPGFQGSSGWGDDKSAQGATSIAAQDMITEPTAIVDRPASPSGMPPVVPSSGTPSSDQANATPQRSTSAATMTPPAILPAAPASPASPGPQATMPASGSGGVSTPQAPLRSASIPPSGPGRPAPFGGVTRPAAPSNASNASNAPNPRPAMPAVPPVRPSAFPPRPPFPTTPRATPPTPRPSLSAQPTTPTTSAMAPRVSPAVPAQVSPQGPPQAPAQAPSQAVRLTAPVARPSVGGHATPSPAATSAATPPTITPASVTSTSVGPTSTARTSTAPTGSRAASGTPTRVPINPFLANDPNAKARRLARALVSDLVTYFPQKREEGLRNGNMKDLFREEVKKSYEEFVDQVGREFADATTHFQDALNDILGGGQKIF